MRSCSVDRGIAMLGRQGRGLRRAIVLVTLLGAIATLARLPTAYAAEPNWPPQLVIGTASAGGTYQVYGQGLARILTRELRLPVVARATGGPRENIDLLEAGEVQLAFVTMGVALQAWNGSGTWTSGRQYRSMRALFPMYDTPFHFIARVDAGIAAVADLQGREVGVGPEDGTAATYAAPVFGTLAITVRPAFGAWEDLVQRLEGRTLDAMMVAAGVPFPAVAGLEARKQIRHLPLTAEQVTALRLALPELTASIIPAGSYPSLQRGYRTVGLYNFAVARHDLPPDLAYQIVKTVFDRHEEMLESHPAAAATVPANFVRNTFLPYHEGAVRYYGNVGAAGVLLAD